MEKTKSNNINNNKNTSNVSDDNKNVYSLHSLEQKLRKSEPITFNNYFVDLQELLSENYDYK